jgi:transcriptional regulator with GAF, ATPase, and Fis domain
MPGQDFEELAVALAETARDLLAQETLQSTLDRISEHAVDLVEGCEAAGILTVRRHSSGRGGVRYTVRTLACTDDLVEASDQLQEEVGEGPCFDATRDRREVLRIADMSDQAERWPRFTPRAREPGIGSMIGFMLFTSEQNLGSLNMDSRSPGALTERSEHNNVELRDLARHVIDTGEIPARRS